MAFARTLLRVPLPMRRPLVRPAAAALPMRHFAAAAFDDHKDEDMGAAPAAAAPSKGYFTFLNKENIVAPDNYNRWLSVPAAFLVQLSIGSVYAWSIFNGPLTREMGVVAPAAADWQLGSVVDIFATAAISLGASTALLGPWAERSGPRKVAVAAAVAWSTGLLSTAFGAYTHQLPFLYLGYGVLGGMGWGLGYISPVSTLMRWFPDRRGMAAGLALTAFGGGAMLATPINELLLHAFFELPTYLGTVDAVQLVTEAGKRFANVGGALKEVVVATASDVSNLPGTPPPGVYVVGTGNTGAARTFMTLSGVYCATMCAGAFMQRVPREGWLPANWKPPAEHHRQSKMISHRDVHHTQALKTPQFYLMWLALAGNATAGVTMLSCAKTLMSEIFGSAMPAVVTGTFAATYVAMLSGANMGGRLLWANVSDYIGRKQTYFLFGLSVPILCALPSLTESAVTSAGLVPLVAFYAGTFCIVSFYGGVFSVLPAYLSDIFGQKHVGAIHGRALTAWSAAALTGPTLLAYFRNESYEKIVNDLASKVDPTTFLTTFGAPVSDLKLLLTSKTVNIPQLMEIMPPGTVDPTPTLYNATLYSMAVIATVAMAANALVGPVHAKHHLPARDPHRRIHHHHHHHTSSGGSSSPSTTTTTTSSNNSASGDHAQPRTPSQSSQQQ